MTTPRVSILIPNFNNGKASSKNGRTDLIGDLLVSLRDTLADDPTPYEIIAYDDGSTDDSLDTLREWASQGFLQLIEEPHCGVLSKTANRLVRESAGDILVRLDGDITVLTPNWAQHLCAIFDEHPESLGVVGPKQLAPDGQTIHSFGDFILHPKGYHHLHQGKPREAVTVPAEVDHVMGCFYCCRRSVYDKLGGYDENILRGQTIDFGLLARKAGYRCFAVPHIEFIHRHTVRKDRANVADTDAGVEDSRLTFKRKWGFDRLAPDLAEVRKRYAGTPLLWNAQVFGMPMDIALQSMHGPKPTIDQSAWTRFASDENYQQQTRVRLATARNLINQLPAQPRVGLLYCGEGLSTHLLARQGINCQGCDPSIDHVTLARSFMQSQSYPADAPVISHQPDLNRLPWADKSLDAIFWTDALERHPNPAPLIADARRCLTDTGLFVAMVPQSEYFAHEIGMFLNAAADWVVLTPGTPPDKSHPIVAVASPTRDTFDALSSVAA